MNDSVSLVSILSSDVLILCQVLLIVDMQVGLLNLARDFDATLYYNNMITHAAIGELFDIPIIMTTSAQTG